MCSNDTGVDEDQRVIALLRQGIKYPLPNPALRPAIVTIIHRRSRTIALRQVPPRCAGA